MRVLNALFVVIGICIFLLGLYTGIWLMLVGGIVDIVNQVKAPETDAMTIALAIVKIIFCMVPVWISLFLANLVAGALIIKTNRRATYGTVHKWNWR